MNYTDVLNANDLVKIIKACGEAGVTEFPMPTGIMKLTPRYVAEAGVVAREALSETQTVPEQLELLDINDDADELLPLTDPVEWQRQGLKGDNHEEA